MYCDGCGRPFSSGTRYCVACGKQLMAGPATTTVPGGAPLPATAGARTAGDGRVRRNINLVAGFWLASGVLRLLALGGLMIFRRLFFLDGRYGMGSGGWPFGSAFGFNPFFAGGLFSAGAFLVVFAAGYLLLGWGLLERQPWARILGIVLGFLVLIRIPFGTALGIYTLWVLLPESSAREYDAMAGAGGQVSVAR
jgi:hypothetical protein